MATKNSGKKGEETTQTVRSEDETGAGKGKSRDGANAARGQSPIIITGGSFTVESFGNFVSLDNPAHSGKRFKHEEENKKVTSMQIRAPGATVGTIGQTTVIEPVGGNFRITFTYEDVP